jgi:DNA mismatch repair protein MutL
MGKIIVLDENTSNKIAAGEVIERPASLVKELLENSIDAGATSINIEIKNGGITLIKISDNGSGIDEDDVEIAFERHATSKIRNSDDLDKIATLGFRGEALASIAAVSSVELITRVKGNPHGTLIKIKGGSVKEVSKTGCPVGTTFIVKDLFYNTPARFKFLKKDTTEAGYISDIITRVALSNPHISFKLISNNALLLQTPGNNDLLSVIYSIYGKETSKSVLEINYTDNKVKITGFAGKTEISRSTRAQQSIYVNGRYIKSKIISSAIDEAYKTYLLKNKYAFIILKLEVNPMLIDVNVHPTKMEIRFSEEQEIFRSVFHAINNAFTGKDLTKSILAYKNEDNMFKINNEQFPQNYSQQNISFKAIVNEPKIENAFIPSTFRIKKELNQSQEEAVELIKEEKKVYPFKSQETMAPINSDLKVINLVNNDATPKKQENVAFINTENTENKKDKTENKKDKEDKADTADKENKNAYINFDNTIIIGQMFSTYIMLQKENELILIDQHAAHERIRYEFYKEKFKNNESFSQELLAPTVIELSNQEIKFILEEKEFFNKLGFKYDDFGNNSIILRSVPLFDEGVSIRSAFLEVADSILAKGKLDYKRITDEAIYTIACKSAVKGNKKMSEPEIRNLLKDLSKIENPYTCPHGRPTIIKLSKYELEKMFKRII